MKDNNVKNPTVGGLLKDLKPNQELKVKNTNYIIRNVGLYPIRIHVYLEENKIIMHQRDDYDETRE